jgi:hypothetical protein
MFAGFEATATAIEIIKANIIFALTLLNPLVANIAKTTKNYNN